MASILLALSCAAQHSPAARVIDLTAQDGVKLKATFFASAKPGPAVLLLHQCNRQRKVWDELAQQLASAGINTLTLDLRGFGESGGTHVDKLSPKKPRRKAKSGPATSMSHLRIYLPSPGLNVM